MAMGVARQHWDHTAFLAAWIGSSFGGKRIDPQKLHPISSRDRPPPRRKVDPVIFVQTLAMALGAKQAKQAPAVSPKPADAKSGCTCDMATLMREGCRCGCPK